MLFEIGKLISTFSIAQLRSISTEFDDFVQACLNRYINGDWGDMCEDDAQLNNEAAKNGVDRIMSAYKHPDNKDWRIWIVTEADRSVTTILFPSEY